MTHPINDVVVVVPGIMGSTLHRHGTPVWEPSRGGIVEVLRSRFNSVKDLRLPEGIGDGHPDDGVTAEALMPDIRLPLGLWTFDIGYTKLLRFLTDTFALNNDPTRGLRNLITFPYDWRLSNRYNGTRLGQAAETALEQWRDQGGEYSDAGLVFICHSMGGLVARWYIDHLAGATNTRTLITLGTPHRGSLDALDQLANGIRQGPGSFKVNLSAFGRSLPSVHQLLPEYACIERDNQLHKSTEVTIPAIDTAMVSDAMSFHTQIDTARLSQRTNYELHPIGGYEQPTLTTARVTGEHLDVLRTIDGNDEQGDGTVPRLSFTPPDVTPSSAILHYAADNHGGLVHNRSVYDQIEGILTARTIVHRAPPLRLSVDIAEVLDPGEPLTVVAQVVNGDAPLEIIVADSTGSPIGPPRRLLPGTDGLQANVPLPGPGVYEVTTRGAGPVGVQVSPITTIVLAWPTEADLDLAATP